MNALVHYIVSASQAQNADGLVLGRRSGVSCLALCLGRPRRYADGANVSLREQDTLARPPDDFYTEGNTADGALFREILFCNCIARRRSTENRDVTDESFSGSQEGWEMFCGKIG